MFKLIYKILGLLFIVLALFGCKSTKTNHDSRKTVDKYEITNTFLTAKRSLMRANRVAAIEGFNKCIANNPKHDASYFELAKIYEYHDANVSISNIKKAIEISPNNVWYKEFYIRLLKEKKNYTEAIKINKDLIKIEPNNKNYYYQRANLFIYNKDTKNAENTYNQILDKFGYEEGVLNQKKQIFISTGEYKKAINVLQELIKQQPNNKNYYGMIAELYLRQGENDIAMQYYEKILIIDPNDGYVHFALADYYRSKGENQRAQKELEVGMSSENLSVNNKMTTLLRVKKLAENDNTMQANFEKLLAIATSTHPENPKILALNADYNKEEGKLDESIKYYKKILSIDSSKFVIWNELLIAYDSISDTKSLINYSDRALRLFPQQSKLYFYNATANSNLGNWEQAKEKAKMGANFVYKSTDKALLLALRANAEMHLGEIDNGIANYDYALSIDASNSAILRDYAYALALNNRNTTQAVVKAKQALELNAGDIDYEYVYIYCLFKDNQKDLALKWLKPAMIKHPNSKKLQLLDMEINKNE